MRAIIVSVAQRLRLRLPGSRRHQELLEIERGFRELRAQTKSLADAQRQLKQMGTAVKQVSIQLSRLDDRVARIDKRVAGINERVAGIDERVRKLQQRVGRQTPRWGPEAEPVPLDYAGANLKLTPTTKLALKRSRAAAKEPFTVAWIEGSLGAGDVFYDIGANIGAYSLIAARQKGGHLTVVSFEPSYSTYATLCENVVLNDVADVVKPLLVLLGEQTSVSAVRLRDRRAGAALHERVTGGADEQTDTARDDYRQPVLAYRIDDLVAAGLPAPNHIKLDVDGVELSVLRGAEEALTDPRLKSMMIEVAESDAVEIGEVLAEHGIVEHARHKRLHDPASGRAFWYAHYVRQGC